ncbi:unnamed protein product [Ixodes pacificus]
MLARGVAGHPRQHFGRTRQDRVSNCAIVCVPRRASPAASETQSGGRVPAANHIAAFDVNNAKGTNHKARPRQDHALCFSSRQRSPAARLALANVAMVMRSLPAAHRSEVIPCCGDGG